MTPDELLAEWEPTWMADGLCRTKGIPTSAFFPERGASSASYAWVRPVCWACAVRPACLTFIMRLEGDSYHQQRHGFWAGYSPRERYAMYRRGAA